MLEQGLVNFSERRPAPFKALTWYNSSFSISKYLRLQNDEYNGIYGKNQNLECR